MLVPHVSQWFAPVIGAIKKWFQADSYKADSVSPSLILDFANNRYAANSSAKNFSDILTFTRGSTGPYFNSAGVMQTAAVDTPRFDYDPATGTALGLLIEESRTNQVRQSGITMSGSSGTLTSGQSDIAGGTDATMYTEPVSGSSSPQLNFGTTVSATAGNNYTYSAYVKAGTCDRIQLFTTVSLVPAGDGYANFYLNGAGSVTQRGAGCYAASIQQLANGWYRVVASFTAVSTGTGGLYLCTLASGTETRAPNINATGRTYTIFGAQAEIGAFVTSYIPTTTTSVTRSADSVSNTGSNTVPFSSWYNSAAGTMYADFDYQYRSNIWANIVNVSDGTSNNHVKIAAYANNMGAVPVTTGGAAQYSPSPQYGATAGVRTKGVVAASLNDAIAYFNATALASDTSVSMPTVTALYLGRRVQGDASEMINGHIRELRFYNQRITNSELQRITT